MNWSPIISGLLGGVIAVLISAALSRWVLTSANGKSATRLLEENRTAVRASDALVVCGLLGALALYQFGGFARNDWRPLTLGFGLAGVAPLIILPIGAFLAGRPLSDAFYAYSIAKKLPPVFLYAMHSLCIPLLVLGLWGFFK